MEDSDDGASMKMVKSTSSSCIQGVKRKLPVGRSPRLLPPINNDESSSSGHQISKSNIEERSWSRFHSDCKPTHSIYLDWTSEKAEKAPENKIMRKISKSMRKSDEALKQQEVEKYLDKNKEFLEAYIFKRVPAEVLEKWLMSKKTQDVTPSTSQSSTSTGDVMSNLPDKCFKQQILTELLEVLQNDPDEHLVIWELAVYITKSIGVDAYRVFKLFPDQPGYAQYFVVDNQQPNRNCVRSFASKDIDQVSLMFEVAMNGTCQRFSRDRDRMRFPKTPVTLLKSLKENVKQANYLMYQPILRKQGQVVYVIEMWRIREEFKDIDEEISSNFLVLSSLALHYCNLYLDKMRERNMSDFLLEVVKAIFEEMVSLDQLIKRILEFAQRLVHADRASIFLVDYRNFELVSTVFDLKFESGNDRDMEKKEIRMPINRGIAGHVALSGEPLNIPDAYADFRFNREVDEATGYKTVNILCMPIKLEGKVIGVVQMVNKRSRDNFNHEDEVAFEIFSNFFGLALHHARLYDKIQRKEQKYRVALEVLSYHNTCRETEVTAALIDEEPISVDLNDFYLDPYKLDEFQKCKCVIKMFGHLFDMTLFDITTLTRFVLTVRKNYRTVPYHNFDHGWTVAHAMYVLLLNETRNRFNFKMRLALFVACLCHDLDHRGYTNKYMSETASPLAAMYTTSTLEHHHFNITVTILQQEGHNIFSHMSSEDYKTILGYIKHCILATDLALFFVNLKKMNELHDDECSQFDWDVPRHKELAMAICMTAADLSASAKPWDIQMKTVKVIFEEFYYQGDMEKAAGLEPIPMMDRTKPDQQGSSQVGFLKQICIPCYSMLYRILPNSRQLYAMAMKNLDRWKAIAYKTESNSDSTPDSEHEDDNEASSVMTNLNTNMAKLDLKDIVKGCFSWDS